MVETHFLLENLWISEPSLGILEKFQRSSDLPNIKYNCVLLFLNQLYWVFIYESKYIFSYTPMLKCEQKLLILSFKEEITEVPAGCSGREITYQTLTSTDAILMLISFFCSLWRKIWWNMTGWFFSSLMSAGHVWTFLINNWSLLPTCSCVNEPTWQFLENLLDHWTILIYPF